MESDAEKYTKHSKSEVTEVEVCQIVSSRNILRKKISSWQDDRSNNGQLRRIQNTEYTADCNDVVDRCSNMFVIFSPSPPPHFFVVGQCPAMKSSIDVAVPLLLYCTWNIRTFMAVVCFDDIFVSVEIVTDLKNKIKKQLCLVIERKCVREG